MSDSWPLDGDGTTEDQLSALAVLSCKQRGSKLHVTEYLDLATGEILDAKEARKRGVTSIRPDAMVRRKRKLETLRVEPKKFAQFLLRFRDQQCGFLVGVDTLVKWYSRLTGMASKNIRRYFDALTKAGILDHDHVLDRDFMVRNPKAGKVEARGATFKASCMFSLMLLRSEQTAHFLPTLFI